ncbi:M1 family aminopeptidase [Corallococcus interemptor]|uniref:M1 family aminopeptidase n=1 Tax=Corallococcus interemptor TaxID=2316720 RepID=UPI003D01A2F6
MLPSWLRRFALPCFVLGVTGCESSEPSLEPPGLGGVALAYTVDRYDFAFDLTTGEAASRLALDVEAGARGCVSLPAPPEVTGVRWDGGPADFRVVDGHLEVCGVAPADGPLWIDSQQRVAETTVPYTRVGFSRRLDAQGRLFTYLLGWLESCDLFGPCDPAPGRLAHFTFDVTHAPGALVLCPGSLSRRDDTHTRCELLGTRAPSYSAFMIASHPAWQRTRLVDTDVGRVELYEPPGGMLGPAIDAGAVAEFLAWMTARFGPLPYGPELRVASGRTDWLGMEHPANIVLRDDLQMFPGAYANMTLHTLLHEIAHQWAGNRTTLASAGDYPWKEAVAEYLAYVFEYEHRSNEAAATLAYLDRLARTSSSYLRPKDTPAPPFLTFVNDVYGTGPMILLVQLESLLGRPQVLAGLQAFLSEPGVRSIEDLRRALETASGQDLQRYFDTWVDGQGEPDWPFFQVEWQQGEAVALTVTQRTESGKVYPCEVDLELQGAAPGERRRVTVSYGLAPDSATAELTVEGLSWKVQQVVVDPRSRLVNRRSLSAVP